jgi:hypothetical protein
VDVPVGPWVADAGGLVGAELGVDGPSASTCQTMIKSMGHRHLGSLLASSFSRSADSHGISATRASSRSIVAV